MEQVVVPRWVEQALGASLVLLVLLDVIITVLYARVGTGIISHRLAHLTWRAFLAASKLLGRSRPVFLSFCAPIILVLLVLIWAFTLTIGSALIIHPALGTSVTAGSGTTPTDFVTAMYAGGSSMAIVGASDFTPRTDGFRAFYLFNSLVAMAILSLTLTYLMQVYTALKQRNIVGLQVDLTSAGTGDAAELIARVGPEGQFTSGYTNLSELAAQVVHAKESHHFYPVLFYFRFPDPCYSVSRFCLVSLDAVTLIESGLDDERYAWLKRSAALTQLGRACTTLMATLADTFLPGAGPDPHRSPDTATLERWQRRYVVALRRLRRAGIRTTADESAGAELYVELRRGWDRYVATLAPAMGYRMDEIDPAGCDPGAAEQRQERRAGLRPSAVS